MSRFDLSCALCGNERPGQVVSSWIRWADARPGQEYTAAPRCTDRRACRDRVESAGEAWDVLDAEPRAARP